MLQKKMYKQPLWMVLLMLLVMVLAACSGTATTTEAPAATVAPTTATEPTAAPTEAPAEAAAEATEAPTEEAADTTTEATAEATEEASEEAAATEVPAEEVAGMSGTVNFVIDAAQSEVRFTLDELLMGNPTTVVGVGNGIEGSITINFDDFSQTTISPIVIDASLLATDNNMRNGQIRRAVLQTNNPEFQYITFTPTSVEGLPTEAPVGTPFTFSVVGDLTIRTITQPMTFEVTVTPVSESEISGNARATLLRADFDLQIPSVPSVADVSEEVLLEFDFVALAQ
jgi:polyisoprenoid-binding protein YceI